MLLGNVYKATITGLAMGGSPIVVVRFDSGDHVSLCLLDCIKHIRWSRKDYFLEEYELLAEGIWEKDKVLIIDRIFRLELGCLVEIIN